ncbi:MAG TPA: hypothetical protein VFK86_07065 [Bauldia sp.]|nr:hypothetical protein [Bauldia sp.]
MLTAIPLTVIPLIIYNLVAFVFPGTTWTGEIFGLTMVSGARWALTLSDLMITLAIAMLFLEIMKSGRTGSATLTNHILSTIVLLIYVIEFILLDIAATSLFFILTIIALFDVIAGFSITIRTATRDIAYTPGFEPPHPH